MRGHFSANDATLLEVLYRFFYLFYFGISVAVVTELKEERTLPRQTRHNELIASPQRTKPIQMDKLIEEVGGVGLPSFVLQGFNKDKMAKLSEEVDGKEYLYTGKAPAVGQKLFVHIEYQPQKHVPVQIFPHHEVDPDTLLEEEQELIATPAERAYRQRVANLINNSNNTSQDPQIERIWARMVGEIHTVFPDPPNIYWDGTLEDQMLRAEHQQMFQAGRTMFPPALYFETSKQLITEHWGTVHGKRIGATLRLSSDDEERCADDLGGEWDAQLIFNDNLEHNQWMLLSMEAKK